MRSFMRPPSGDEDARFRRGSNNAGGTEGGITNGEPLVIRAVMKPIATLMKQLPSVNLQTKEGVPAFAERSDVCAVPAAAVVGEAMVAIVLAGEMCAQSSAATAWPRCAPTTTSTSRPSPSAWRSKRDLKGERQ